MITPDSAGKRRQPKKKSPTQNRDNLSGSTPSKVKFVVYGAEILEKTVALHGKSGRIYLPSDWIDHKVKIVRIT